MGLSQFYIRGADSWRRRGFPDIKSSQRPTGPGYVRYEDLYQPGDTVTQALDRLWEPAVVTFPEGLFAANDFVATQRGVQTNAAINLDNSKVRGIVGSGPGTLGADNGTIFSITEGSSTKADVSSGTTPWRILRSVGASVGNMEFGQFQIRGTEQGHAFHGMIIYAPGGDVSMYDVLVSGWSGWNSYPPGETFGIELHMGASGYKGSMLRVESDPRRLPGGANYGAAGLTIESSYGAEMRECIARSGTVAAACTLYRCFNLTTYDCVFGAADAPVPSSPGSILNHEVFDGIRHVRPRFLHNNTGGLLHSTAATNYFTSTYGDHAVDATNGSIELIAPSFTPRAGDTMFRLQSWSSGIDGNVNGESSMTQAPDVWTDEERAAFMTYHWWQPGYSGNPRTITGAQASLA